MIPPRSLLAAALLALPAFGLSQTIEFGNIDVVQNDAGNAATSVTLTRAPGSSPNFSIVSGNRGDFDVTFGAGKDAATGVLISAVSQNGRDNSGTGDTIGLSYGTSAVDFVGASPANRYWIPVFRCADGDEFNINVACAWFPYNQWLGGLVRNSAGTNGGANNTLTASAGINLGVQFIDNGSGLSTVNLTSLGAHSNAGVLLVTHAKNEDNFAMSRANADGSFTIYVHDNGVNGASYEQDPVAFVYIPASRVGSDQLVAAGRVNSNATTDVAGGTFTVTKGGTGQWYLSIPGQTNTSGVLIVSPEGGGTNTIDNVVSYQWDPANSRWIIESRDLSGSTTQPTLQNGNANAEDMFSFAFFETTNNSPVAAITAPVEDSFIAPANFTIETSVTDTDGTVTLVELLRNGIVVASDDTAPYAFDQSGLVAGGYNYIVRATDDTGATGLSAAKAIIVNLDPANLPPNTALRFDGINDHVTMGVAPELNAGGPPTNGFSLECWFYKDGAGITASSGSGGVAALPLISKGRGESDGGTQDCNYLFGINTSGRLTADFESYATGLNHPVTASSGTIVNNQWYHAAVTFDGNAGVWKLYLDGAEVGAATVSVSGALPRYDSLQHSGIAAAFNTAGVPEGAFAGVIDEVRVWNYARSAAEIAGAKDQEIGSAGGLIGRFGFNEGSGDLAASSSGASVGALTNGPAWVGGAPFATANIAPTVTLTAPVNDASSFMPYPVAFTATAADADGSIAKVEFLVDGTKVGEDATEPYSYDWTPPAVATYSVTARAVDNLGGGKVSTPASLNILANPNQAPVVTLASPADGASITGASTQLQANLTDPEGDAMTVTFYGRHATPPTPGPDFTLVAIPDTQYYSEGSAGKANTVTVEQLIGTFGAQTQWIVNNKAPRNIAFVSHMGDIVESGNNGGNDIQWQRASAAMGKLENPINVMRAHGIPYGVSPGNHDIDPIGSYDTGSTAMYNQFFGVSRFMGRDYYGGHYGTDNTNSFNLFSASGLDFISIHLAYDTSPNQPILDWADALLKAYPHRRAIITSHYIIGQGNPASFGAQGAAIYNALKDNPNLFLMLCGHIHAEGRRTDTFEGRTVYTVLSDYQGLPNGGQGFLRTFTFSPANNRIRVESWSPTLNRAATAGDGLPHFDGTFDIPYNMQDPTADWAPLGTVNVPAGGDTASVTWTGLEKDQHFEWYAAATDGISTVSTTPRHFTTSSGTAPVVTLDSPANGASYLTPATVNLAATATDADGAIARVEFYNGGAKIGEDTDAPYTYAWTNVAPGSYSVSAVAVDDSGLASFSNAASITVALGDIPPSVTLTSPASGALLEAPATVTLVADATDPEAAVAKVEFYSGAINPVYLGEDNSAPFELELTNVGAGSYTYTAKAFDSVGQTATSAAVTISVFTEAPAPNVITASVGTFDPPSWTIVKTSPAPLQFDSPGTDTGDLQLRINGAPVPFNSGIALAANWGGPASTGNSSDDNISQPYSNASGNLFVSVLDNTNNNASDANPGTSEQTSGVSVAFLPYSGGWTGASIGSGGNVLSGNLPAGVTVAKTGTGTYTISGLSTAGNLLVSTNGDSGTLADNVASVRIVNNRWVIDTRDNAGGTQDNEFTFAYIPPASAGVYAGAISSAGAVSATNSAVTALGGATVTVSADYYELTFGDGNLINPATAALFLVADATVGGSTGPAVDNLISWSPSGNAFRIFTQDLPGINGAFEAINLRFAALPFTPPAPSATTLAATNITPTSATLNATVNPNGAATTAFFQHGLADAYGTDTPVTLSPDNGIAGQAVSVNLTGLTPGTTYHFRITASSALGLMEGADLTFTTPAAAVLSFSAASYEVNQGATSVDLIVTRSGYTAPIAVTLDTNDGTTSAVPPFAAALAGTDYTDLSTTLDFAEGETSKTITVTLIPKTGTANKRFFATLSATSAGGVLGAQVQTAIKILTPDTTKPTLTLTAPPAPTATVPVPLVSASSPYLLKGTAGDAKGVNRVEVALNGAPPVAATIGSSASNSSQPFSLPIEPLEGENTVVVTVYDLRGNFTSITRTFNFTQRSVLTLTRAVPAGVLVDSAGTVAMTASPAKDASALAPAVANSNPKTATVVPGTSIKLTATAKAGYVFSHWSGLPAGAATTGNVVAFTMPAEEVADLTAVFVENPFIGPAGSSNIFYGLVHGIPGTTVSNETVGFITGTLTPASGLFSGKVLIGGVSKSFTATFYGDGSALFTVGTTREPELAFNDKVLTLEFAGGEIIASLATGGEISTGAATRGIYSTANKVPAAWLNQTVPATAPAPNKGFFTIGLPAKEQTPAADHANYPQGDGYATITLSDNGTFTLTGYLADGTSITGSSGIVEGDNAPIFVQVTTPGGSATTKGGSFSGILSFDTASADTDVSGTDLLWLRPAVTPVTTPAAAAAATNLYTGGWPNGIYVDAAGALYDKALTVQAGLGIGAADATEGNAELAFSDGKLTESITKSKFNVVDSKVTKIPATDSSYTLTLSATTGGFSGTFTPNWAQPNTAKPGYKGIMIQKGANRGGFGFFLSNAKNDLDPESGGVTLSPQE